MEFDYVIVGAGTAGCVLAHRLSADPATRVLLLEAGGPDRAFNIQMPAGSKALLGKPNPFNWFDFTEPQAHLGGRRMYWPAGRGWGGTSSINGMAYVRGHPLDYDGWAAAGLPDWSYDRILPYFLKAEANVRGASRFHGGDGPLRISDTPGWSALSQAFVEAGMQAGHPLSRDFNGEEPEGFGALQMTLHKGRRVSAASAYLHPALGRPNLKVISHARVTRVRVEQGRASAVEWLRAGQREVARAAREIVLCAGVARTPQVLMLSGIGDARHLREHGVEVLCDSPEVGRNLQDHVAVQVKWTCPLPVTLYRDLRWYRTLWAGLRYLATRSGPAAGMGVEANGFVHSRPGLSHPDLQIALMNALMEGEGIDGLRIERHGFTLSVWNLRPESRGTITLRSPDPLAAPVIQPEYMSAPADAEVLRAAVGIVREVVAQPAFDSFRGEEVSPGPEVTGTEGIADFVNATAGGLFHPVGSARMGSDARSVVDPALRVRGVAGLRIADASIMPRIVSGNTAAAVFMIAEKAADLIARDKFQPRVITSRGVIA
ncbi:choline dehydrogenase [Sphingomonas sp. LH128]|uniref:GMC family oxidoreductase n=1 Tax=Sphingomonas sp. LH128 TaxID=473781 RepID=UPI00027CA360|nr:choline dehydrogenase [Sphingomonas sp. LH128]EJU12829.1 choline dehydrogenase [Sphingomonas sp. LH128]